MRLHERIRSLIWMVPETLIPGKRGGQSADRRIWYVSLLDMKTLVDPRIRMNTRNK